MHAKVVLRLRGSANLLLSSKLLLCMLFHAIFLGKTKKACLLWDFSEKSELLKLRAFSYKCGVSAELPWFAFLTTGFEYSVWALSQKRSKNV